MPESGSWLRKRDVELIQRLVAPQERPVTTLERLAKAINSPIAITLISGLFVAGVTQNWQAQAAQHDSKEKAMVAFADQFAKHLNLLPTLKARELGLRALLNPAAGSEQPSSIEIESARKNYEKTSDQVGALSDTRALTSQVRATFGNNAIDLLTQQLDRLVDQIGYTPKLDDALRKHGEAIVIYQDVVSRMGKELRE